MGNPLRNSDPNAYRLVTLRTAGARLWFIPQSKVNRLIGGIIARYQEILGIEIYAYCILGNHYHLLIKAPRGNADEFFENVNREIARRMNWMLRQEGQFWARRYSEQIVPTEADVLEAFLYINTNPTKHGLLEDSSRWPGLTSYKHSLKESHRRFSFTMYSSPDGEPKKTTHYLKLSPLPQFESLTRKQRAKKLRELLLKRQEELVAAREEQGLGFLGLEGILSQVPGAIPSNVARSPRPVCYTKCPKVLKEMRKQEAERRNCYAEASFLYRLGLPNYQFPQHCYLPPLHRKPRFLPFQIVSAENTSVFNA